MGIIARTERIAETLQERMDSLTFRWKDSDSTTSYGESKPRVYSFTYDDLDGDFPLHTPCVCIQLLGIDDSGLASYLAHVCVCNPATVDKEITKPVKDTDGIYEYGTGDGINSAFVRGELYKYCILLGEQVYLALKRMGNTDTNISNVQFNTPSPYLASFPYCECTISFESDLYQPTEQLDDTELENML